MVFSKNRRHLIINHWHKNMWSINFATLWYWESDFIALPRWFEGNALATGSKNSSHTESLALEIPWWKAFQKPWWNLETDNNKLAPKCIKMLQPVVMMKWVGVFFFLLWDGRMNSIASCRRLVAGLLGCWIQLHGIQKKWTLAVWDVWKIHWKWNTCQHPKVSNFGSNYFIACLHAFELMRASGRA